jgi:hypothetical protein
VNPEPEGRPHLGQEPDAPPIGRPHDVDTGFWLWLSAVPVMVIGYVIDLVATEQRPPALVLTIAVMFVVIVSAVVVTFQILLRHGYRWARTVLTGGGIASVVYVATSLFTVERPTAAAVAYAVSAIVGSVLIVGGVFLLHRKDAHTFFTR